MAGAFAWKTQGHDVSVKLLTLKLIARSFQRHMERLMELEERDGYMECSTSVLIWPKTLRNCAASMMTFAGT